LNFSDMLSQLQHSGEHDSKTRDVDKEFIFL